MYGKEVAKKQIQQDKNYLKSEQSQARQHRLVIPALRRHRKED
jgi:hypothetical protein